MRESARSLLSSSLPSHPVFAASFTTVLYENVLSGWLDDVSLPTFPLVPFFFFRCIVELRRILKLQYPLHLFSLSSISSSLSLQMFLPLPFLLFFSLHFLVSVSLPPPSPPLSLSNLLFSQLLTMLQSGFDGFTILM